MCPFYHTCTRTATKDSARSSTWMRTKMSTLVGATHVNGQTALSLSAASSTWWNTSKCTRTAIQTYAPFLDAESHSAPNTVSFVIRQLSTRLLSKLDQNYSLVNFTKLIQYICHIKVVCNLL